jgi:hypothetical protein
MDEDQTPQQDGQAPLEPGQVSEQNMNQMQPQAEVPTPAQTVHKKSKKLVLFIVLLVLLFVGGGTAAYLMSLEEEPAPAETIESSEAATPEDLVSSETEEPVAEEPAVEDNEYFTLEIPEGYDAVGERIFTYTGAPASTYSFKNAETNDYFEVNIEPAQSGINPDFVWTYVYADGVFTLDKSDSTVCTAEEDEWCETSGGNGRLDSAIFSEPSQEINGNVYYFTFGNTESEVVGDLSFVDLFFEGLEIK